MTVQVDTQDRVLAVAMKRLERMRLAEAFDPIKLSSRPTPVQQSVIDDFGRIPVQWIVAGNQSGKSQTCSRLVSWVLTETHPSWSRPADWGQEPLLILVAGRTGKQIEESLLPKLESYLEEGSYKVVRAGGQAQRIEHENGNRIVFQSLENPNVARERIQSYVAHLVWIDEQPPTVAILDELQRRIQARSGYLLASFTPLVVNLEITRMVDAAQEPYSKKYQFAMLDNPLYSSSEKRAELLASMATLPEAVRRTRLYGEWSAADDAVYSLHYETDVEMPPDYDYMWRHVESVDPALKSALGLTLWAEHPVTGIWYCVLAEYVKGIYSPTHLVRHVRKRLEGRNIVRRVSDPHEVWYIQVAAEEGIHYDGVYKKSERKGELIKNLQEGLGTRLRISPNCSDLITEFQECRWSPTTDNKIVNGSKYHLLDSAQYAVDNLPKFSGQPVRLSWEEQLRRGNQTRLVERELAVQRVEAAAERRQLRSAARIQRRRR